MNENPPPAPEVPANPVQAENPPPAAAPAPPPAATIVVNGTKTERELELERQLADRDEKLSAAERARRDAEFHAAEKEREAQEARAARVVKPKKERSTFAPVINFEEE